MCLLCFILYLIFFLSFSGMFVIAIFFALQIFLGRMSQKLRRSAVAVTDKRVRAMSEILTSVKMLKFYNWEESFAKKVAKVCVYFITPF